RPAVLRHIANPVAGTRKRLQHSKCRGRRIEADTIADAAVTVRIIGQDQREAALTSWLRLQSGPVVRQVSDKSDAVGDRVIADEIGFSLAVTPERGLERKPAGQDTPASPRQCHIHREIARAKPSRPRAPTVFVIAGKDDL